MRKIIKNKSLVPVTIADLNLDDSPDLNSTDPVTSRGVATAITEAVGGASDALQEQIDDIAEKAGSGYTPKGPASVAILNGLTGQENGWLYTMTDAGTLTDGSLAVTAGDTVAWDATNSVWYKAMDYAPRQYGTNEVHNIATAITAFRTGDVIPVDGPSGTAKMAKDDLLKETAKNALGSIHSLSDTATEADLVAGNYFALDGSSGTKKLPCELLVKTSSYDGLEKRTKLCEGCFDDYENLVKVGGGTFTTSQYYIYVDCDFVVGETYKIDIERSAAHSANITLQSRDSSSQPVETIGVLKKGETEDYYVFKPTQDASYICIFDTTNDGEYYNVAAYSLTPKIKQKTYSLYGYFKTHPKIIKGARYANSSFPTVSSSNNRAVIETYLELPIGSFISLESSGSYQFGFTQAQNIDGTGQYADTGWKAMGTKVAVLYKYQSVNIRKTDNSTISDADLAQMEESISFVMLGSADEEGVIIPSLYDFEKTAREFAKNNFVNRNVLTIANHATSNQSDITANTAESTHLSANRGFTCIENDIRITSDGYFVLNHEDNIQSNFVNADGTDIASSTLISTHTLSELKTNYKTKNGGLKICTLDEQLAICKARGMCIVAEVKDFTLAQLPEAMQVVELCKEYLGYSNFALTSFNETLLDAVRYTDPCVTLMYITYRDSLMPSVDKLASSFGNSILYLDYYSVAQVDGIDRGYDDYIDDANAKGVPITAWTLVPTDIAKVSKQGFYKLLTTDYSGIDSLCGLITSTYNGKLQNWAGWESGKPQWHNGSVVDGNLVLADGNSFSYSFGNVKNTKVVIKIAFEGTLDIDSNYHTWANFSYLGTSFNGGCYELVVNVGNATNFTNIILKNSSGADVVIKDLVVYCVEC